MAVSEKIVKHPTNLPHIFRVDIDDSGLLQEVAIVKEEEDGTIYYIQISSLHQIDKQRIKKIVTSIHADKYPLWELLSQAKLSNGMNALDFFHYNCVKTKAPRGALASRDTLASVSTNIDDKMIGSGNCNPAEVQLDPNTKVFAS
jgi:hypothetical protein